VSARGLHVAAVADPDAPDIRTRLDGYVSDVLALPHAGQLADLSIFELAIELGRQLEREILGTAPRLRPSLPRHLRAAGGSGS
jgi:hypothetical protein